MTSWSLNFTTTVQEELANDIHELSTHHKEEITKLLDEYDDQEIETTVELDAYEKECRQQAGELEGNNNIEPTEEEFGQTLPVNEAHQEAETK